MPPAKSHGFDPAYPLEDDPRHPPASSAVYTSQIPLKITLAGISNMTSAMFTGPPDL
jgi:hypothetical protein